ncbi:hypothetical protein [Actinoplanes xinjiangensis]|uniref:hypothetical protein n=1 Tax=Actinoplanes xinjiangensis TaxID=512350 RepID=UPI003414A8A7
MSLLIVSRKGPHVAMATDLATLPTYGLARPTVADLRACITQEAEDGPHLWAQLCRSVPVDPDTDDPTALTLLIMAALHASTGIARVAISSLNIRLRAHTALTEASRLRLAN